MNIGIVGIGLIGSSLARAFRACGLNEIAIYDSSQPHMDQAKALSLGTHYCDTIEAVASFSDIVFVCVPVDTIATVVKALCAHLKVGAIITDVGSVKSALTKEIHSFLPPQISFVPGHPIAGTEFSGPEAGKADLFAGKPYVLIDVPGNQGAMERVAALLTKIKAKIFYLSADKHDVMLAFTSHLPHLCAFSAMNCSEKLSAQVQKDVTQFAGGSFRDFTRVAGSGSAMWTGIFLANRAHIIEAYKLFRQEMDDLVCLIEKSDVHEITVKIDRAQELRKKHTT